MKSGNINSHIFWWVLIVLQMSKQQIMVMNYFQQGDFTLEIAAICTQTVAAQGSKSWGGKGGKMPPKTGIFGFYCIFMWQFLKAEGAIAPLAPLVARPLHTKHNFQAYHCSNNY